MNNEENFLRNLSTDNGTNEQLLHFIMQDGTLTSSEIENYIIMTRKNQVTKVHQTPFYQRNDGRYLTKVKEYGKTKQILAKDEKELYDKLYEFYFWRKEFLSRRFIASMVKVEG